MENNNIIFVCRSTNNKNVRKGELKILRKVQGQNYFEFGESEMNLKKRFYDDEKILEEDFKELTSMKQESEKESLNKFKDDDSLEEPSEPNKKSVMNKKLY